MNLLGGRSQKLTRVKVTTMDADLNSIVIESNWTGRQLFDTVCRIIGLREIWYFGLRYMNKKDLPSWLQMDKKIYNQDVPKQSDGSLHFLFLVKFYPEIVEEELIQDITRHLFFLQIKQSILSMDLYCQPEVAVLLASYAVQALYGDYSGAAPSSQFDVTDSAADGSVTNGGGMELDLSRLLPKSVIDQYDMSAEMWEDRIRKWWAKNSGLSTEDAEMEYLRVAQDLDMYGIQYYSIFNQKDTDLLLGVSAQGIGIYEISNRLSPRPFFPWTEIKNISFQNKLFVICVTDNSKIKFRAQDCSINASILDLCIGTHNLYLRRRQPDLLEIQQMKMQAREQRQKRLVEQNRLTRERELRQQAETDRDRYKAELIILQEQLAALQSVMKSTEESHKLIAEKARVSEKEALELTKRANEAEAEVQRVKLSQMQAEETRMLLERRVRDAELKTQRLMRDAKESRLNHPVGHLSGLSRPNGISKEKVASVNGVTTNDDCRTKRGGHYLSQQALSDGVAAATAANGVKMADFHKSSPKSLQLSANGVDASAVETRFGGVNGKLANMLRHHSYGELHHFFPSSSGAPSPAFGKENGVSNGVTKNGGAAAVLNGATSCVMLSAAGAVSSSSDAAKRLSAIGPKSDGTSATVGLLPPLATDGGTIFHRELNRMYAEIEKSRRDFDQRNRNMKEHLMEFRKDIEMMKRESRQTEHDRIYTSNLQSGIDKYSTLRKSGAGSSKSRVKVFDGL